MWSLGEMGVLRSKTEQNGTFFRRLHQNQLRFTGTYSVGTHQIRGGRCIFGGTFIPILFFFGCTPIISSYRCAALIYIAHSRDIVRRFEKPNLRVSQYYLFEMIKSQEVRIFNHPTSATRLALSGDLSHACAILSIIRFSYLTLI